MTLEEAILAAYDKYFLWSLTEKPGEVPMSFARFRLFHLMEGIDPRKH